MNIFTWQHGFTQRKALETNAQRVREILRENTANTQPINGLIPVVEKALRLEKLIAPTDPLKKDKVKLVNAVFSACTASNAEKQKEAEQQIRNVLSRQPKLSSYVANLRMEFAK